MGIFSSLFKKKKGVLGIDIGTSSIKMIELTKAREKFELANYGEIQTYGSIGKEGEGLIQSSSLKILDSEVAEMIKELLVVSKAKSRDAFISIPLFSSFTTVIELPEMNPKEIANAITFEARQYIPIPINEVLLNWTVISSLSDRSVSGKEGQKIGSENKLKSQREQKKDKKISVLLVAVPNELVNKYVRIAKLANVNLRDLETENFSAMRSLVGNDKSSIAIVDIGGRSTGITIADQGEVRMTHNFDTSGFELTKALSQSVSVDFKRADELKKKHGLLGKGGEQEISNNLKPLIDLIISESDRILHIYTQKTKRSVERVILNGGTAKMHGMVEYFAEKIGKETSLASPFARIGYPPELEPILQEIGPLFSIATGLGMKEG